MIGDQPKKIPIGASLEVSYPLADGVLRPEVIPHLKVSRFSRRVYGAVLL